MASMLYRERGEFEAFRREETSENLFESILIVDVHPNYKSL